MFRNIFLKDYISHQQSQTIFAKTGKIINQNGKNYMILNNGKFLNNDDGEITVFGFEKTEFNLSKYTTKTTIAPKIQELDTQILIKCFLFVKKDEHEFYARFAPDESFQHGSLKCNENFLTSLKQELFKRFYLPFYFPLIALVSCLLITSTKENNNFTRFKFLLFNIGILVIILSEISIRYSGLNKLYSLVFMCIPILLFILTYLYFFNKAKT